MDLITIKTEDNKQVVSARELHNFLESKQEFANWIKQRIEKYGLIENQDFEVFDNFIKNPNGGRPLKEYALTLDCAKEIAMVEGNEKGKQARQYFIECEKKLKQQLPTTFREALLLAAKLEEEREQALLQVSNLNTVLDNLLEWVSIIKVSRFNGVKENRFNWRLLKSKSDELGYAIKKAESPRYGYQNLYHINVFRACYPQYNYNLKK